MRKVKEIKLRVRNAWGLFRMFVEVTGKKLVGRSFDPQNLVGGPFELSY